VEIVNLNGQLRWIGHRCVVPVSKPNGILEYYSFKGHQNTLKQMSNVNDVGKLSVQDSIFCEAQAKKLSNDDPYRIRDEKLLSGE
jgi:hypothetical protein